ncbi:MAG: YaiI/YqxD family protein [Castellaniella sp.]|nr:YaiI/YqxD family protein [Castellaniella sp.]
MNIWVDADACPAVIKDILYRAAQRLQQPLTLVANQMLRTPPSSLIRAVQVSQGFDVADNYIVEHASTGDLVITADIPLASEALGKGALVLSPRGECYTAGSISERLTMRDMMEELRSAGVDTGGPAAFSQADRRAFANALDQLLQKTRRMPYAPLAGHTGAGTE